MPITTRNTLEVRTLDDWRAWLAAHHDSVSEVWLIFYKRATGRPSIAYADALDEALCVGWIDSLIKRIDDQRYARKFTPRKPDSRWSAINRRRDAALEASGRLTPAGLARRPTDRRSERLPVSGSTVPTYIERALEERPTAWKGFERLAPSHRRNYILWIDSARREETKARRLREAIRLLARGKVLGLK